MYQQCFTFDPCLCLIEQTFCALVRATNVRFAAKFDRPIVCSSLAIKQYALSL